MNSSRALLGLVALIVSACFALEGTAAPTSDSSCCARTYVLIDSVLVSGFKGTRIASKLVQNKVTHEFVESFARFGCFNRLGLFRAGRDGCTIRTKVCYVRTCVIPSFTGI